MLHEDLIIKALEGAGRETRTNKHKDHCCCYYMYPLEKAKRNLRLLKGMRLKIWSIYIKDEKWLSPAMDSLKVWKN